LQANLLSPAGEWAGFDEKSLIDRITSRLKKKSKINDLMVEASYRLFRWMCKDYWQKLEKVYKNLQLKMDTHTI
jgi:hypothetical protein